MILNFQVNQFQENHIFLPLTGNSYTEFDMTVNFLKPLCQLVFRDADINIYIESDGSLLLENKFYLLHSGWVRDLPV